MDAPTSERVLLMGQAVTVLQGELTGEKGGSGTKAS
jgi:hypothetical protein